MLIQHDFCARNARNTKLTCAFSQTRTLSRAAQTDDKKQVSAGGKSPGGQRHSADTQIGGRSKTI